MSTAAEHAIIASELLDALHRVDELLHGGAADENLVLMDPAIKEQIELSMDYTVALAHAHAVTAIALERTGGGE